MQSIFNNIINRTYTYLNLYMIVMNNINMMWMSLFIVIAT